MDSGCFGFLRFLLCCQDEYDDTFRADFSLIKRPFLSTPKPDNDRTALLGSASTPVPRSVVRSSQPAHNDYAGAFFLLRAQALSSSSRSSSSGQARPSSTTQPRSSPTPKPNNKQTALLGTASTPVPRSVVRSSQPAVEALSLRAQALSSSGQTRPSSTTQPRSSPTLDLHHSNPKPDNDRTALLGSASTTVPRSVVRSSQLDVEALLRRAQALSSSLRSSSSGQTRPPSTQPRSSPIAPEPVTVKPPSPIAPKPANLSHTLHSAEFRNFLEAGQSSRKQVPNPKARYSVDIDNNDELPLYLIPEHIKDLIRRDLVPGVLKSPLCPTAYKDYFSALLYAEDYYYEKWSDFKLKNVTLELHEATVYMKSGRRKGVFGNEGNEDKIFVAFKIDAIPEKRPYLLSRDLAYARPSDSKVEPFQGIIYRVVKSDLVLVEFEDDFHSKHYPSRRYDISFSFNRVCLKRAHEALNSVSDSLYENFLFPSTVSRGGSNNPVPVHTSNIQRFDSEISSTVRNISSIKSSPPYLVAGPRCASESKSAAHLRQPSRTGVIIQEAVIQIYKANTDCRILICSPSNSSCDVLMRGLKNTIPESQMFRANAAFREKEDVPEDILSSCLYQEECFACPPIQTLRSFKVIFSTFVSSYRLHKIGLPIGYFSHIFMVDSSFAIEPEAMVPLANFADKNTVVVVTGEARTSPHWVRSKIARENGLKVSYFERLRECRPYHSLNPSFITQLDLNREACYL